MPFSLPLLALRSALQLALCLHYGKHGEPVDVAAAVLVYEKIVSVSESAAYQLGTIYESVRHAAPRRATASLARPIGGHLAARNVRLRGYGAACTLRIAWA